MSTVARFDFDRAAFVRYVGEDSRAALQRGSTQIKQRVQRNISQRTRRVTGALHDTVAAEVTSDFSARVIAPAPYAGFQEFGVGPFGPVNARALRFRPFGGGIVFSMRSSGFPAKNFMRDAAAETTISDFI